MKQSLKSALLAVIAMIVWATTSSAQNISLQYLSDKMNKKCPMEVTDRSRLLNTECTDNEIVFNIELKEPDFNLDQLIDNNDYWKTLLADEYNKSGEGTQQMLSLFSNTGVTFKMVCIGSETGKKASCFFTPEETKSLLNARGHQMNNFTIENLIVIINSAAPFPFLEGINITAASKSDDNIIIENSIDETLHNMDDVMRDPNRLKGFILFNLPYNEGMRFLSSMCVERGVNLIIRFSGNQSEKVCYTVLTSKEMQNALNRERK